MRVFILCFFLPTFLPLLIMGDLSTVDIYLCLYPGTYLSTYTLGESFMSLSTTSLVDRA